MLLWMLLLLVLLLLAELLLLLLLLLALTVSDEEASKRQFETVSVDALAGELMTETNSFVVVVVVVEEVFSVLPLQWASFRLFRFWYLR